MTKRELKRQKAKLIRNLVDGGDIYSTEINDTCILSNVVLSDRANIFITNTVKANLNDELGIYLSEDGKDVHLILNPKTKEIHFDSDALGMPSDRILKEAHEAFRKVVVDNGENEDHRVIFINALGA